MFHVDTAVKHGPERAQRLLRPGETDAPRRSVCTHAVTWKTYSSLPAGSSSTNIDGLAGDSNYDFRVVPLNGLTAIASSNIVSGTIPGAATGLSAVASGPSEVELEWGGDQQYNSGYCLQYSTDGVTWQNLTTITSPTSTNYSASGLQPDTQYSFRITAFSATGESAPSNVAVARTLLASRLLAYEGFNYLPDPTNDNQLLGTDGGFGWSGGWGYYGAADGTREVISGSLVASNALVADNLLTTGNTFEADNFGAVSRSLASTTPSAPGTILWLSFLVKTYNVVPVGYVQLVDATGGPNSLSIGFACQYDYSIVIGNTNYWSTGTAPAVDTTHFLVMEISYNASPTTDNVQMWIDPNPAAGSPGTPAIDENTSVALPAFNRINIMAGWYGGYENDWDEIRLGTSYAAVAPTKVPLSPTGLTATPGTGQIDLAWTDSASNTTGYDVQRSTDQINWSTPTDGLLGPDATSYTDSSVTVGTTYYYRVYATGASGNSIDSNTADTMPAVAWRDRKSVV